jgi:hypothetical protein
LQQRSISNGGDCQNGIDRVDFGGRGLKANNMSDQSSSAKISEIDALKSFCDANSNLCRFYHESETKIGAGINFASIIGLAFGKSAIPGINFALIGGSIVLLGTVGLLSIVAYWRYYEKCWAHVEACHEAMFEDHPGLSETVKQSVTSRFDNHRIFGWKVSGRRIFEDAHHWAWLLSMLVWISVGAYLIFCQSACTMLSAR